MRAGLVLAKIGPRVNGNEGFARIGYAILHDDGELLKEIKQTRIWINEE
jgi:hypothetical protein